MRWSKVRKLVEDTFADSVKGRVTVHTTQDRSSIRFGSGYGGGWIMVDGKQIANFDDKMSCRLFGAPYDPASLHESDGLDGERFSGGFYGRWFRESCFDYVHSGLNTSIRSTNALIRSLAVLNAKVGRGRLARLAAAEEHPLPKALAHFRIEAENAARNVTVPAARQRSV
jgi:hypothetical protein